MRHKYIMSSLSTQQSSPLLEASFLSIPRIFVGIVQYFLKLIVQFPTTMVCNILLCPRISTILPLSYTFFYFSFTGTQHTRAHNTCLCPAEQQPCNLTPTHFFDATCIAFLTKVHVSSYFSYNTILCFFFSSKNSHTHTTQVLKTNWPGQGLIRDHSGE